MFSLFVPENSELPTRRAHKKSRNGCVTCKQRKLKCDEIKPVCGNCNRRFLTIEACDYGSGAVFRQRHTAKPITPRTNEVTPAQSSQSTSVITDENTLMNLVLPGSIAGELLDPFKTHPESKVQGIDMLMKYYLSKAVYKNYPWQPPSKTNPTTTYYVPLVWSDPVLFHATLQMSCLRLDKEKKQGCGTLAFGLLGESLRLLRMRVEEEERERGVSDQTISAVATLAAIEHEKGNIARLRMHMNGLQRMISIRGLDNIRETNPMVANSVFWMFVVASYELPFPNLDPTLAPITPTTTSTSDTQHLTSYFADLLPPLPSPLSQNTPTSTPTPTPATPLSFHSLGLHPSISQILLSVQHVSLTVTKSSSYPTASNSLAILTRLMTLLSHLMSIPSIEAETEYSCLISECVRYAILLHVFTPWKGLPPDGSLAINSLLHSLLRVLKRLLALPSDGNQAGYTNELPLHNKNNILVLWIFAVGGVSALGLPERTWFVSHLAEMSEAMGVVSWEDMRACVSRVVWHEMLCAPLHRKLWDEVVEMKEWLAREEL